MRRLFIVAFCSYVFLLHPLLFLIIPDTENTVQFISDHIMPSLPSADSKDFIQYGLVYPCIFIKEQSNPLLPCNHYATDNFLYELTLLYSANISGFSLRSLLPSTDSRLIFFQDTTIPSNSPVSYAPITALI